MSRNSVNKVILLGNLGADPETRFTPTGSQVVTVRLATNDTWTDKNGERRERTEWHRLVLWRGLAEVAGQYLRRGSKVYVEGKLQTRSWEDVKGQRHYMTEVVVSDLQMLDAPNGPGEMDLAYARLEPKSAGGETVEEVAAELPF
ncbi:MAG: single-stranded DNA-binding protein [Candidatus Handelsmanbacteria bacterium]|nr:single-stranded DNA-binding protein [Candidatus Handelsmanbacteria bacterium]